MAVKSAIVVGAVGLIASVLLGGCASSAELARATQGAPAPSTTAAPETGAPSPKPGNGAGPTSPSIASPLRIPLPTDQLQGDIYKSGLPRLKVKIAGACGGSQCVSVRKVGQGTKLEPGQVCDTIFEVKGRDLDGAQRPFVSVRRGGTITLVVNVRCEDVPPEFETPTGSPTEESTSGSSSTDGAPGSTDEP